MVHEVDPCHCYLCYYLKVISILTVKIYFTVIYYIFRLLSEPAFIVKVVSGYTVYLGGYGL